MIRKRCRIEIIYDILKAVCDKKEGIKFTHILYKSNLSCKLLKEYLAELISGGFIREDIGKCGYRMYFIENKGVDFMEDFRKIKEVVKRYGF